MALNLAMGLREESDFSSKTEFERLREVLLWTRSLGLEVTIDGQVEGLDYLHTLELLSSHASLDSYGIRSKVQRLIDSGEIDRYTSEGRTKRLCELSPYSDMPVPVQDSGRHQRVLGLATLALASTALGGIIYALIGYLQ